MKTGGVSLHNKVYVFPVIRLLVSAESQYL